MPENWKTTAAASKATRGRARTENQKRGKSGFNERKRVSEKQKQNTRRYTSSFTFTLMLSLSLFTHNANASKLFFLFIVGSLSLSSPSAFSSSYKLLIHETLSNAVGTSDQNGAVITPFLLSLFLFIYLIFLVWFCSISFSVVGSFNEKINKLHIVLFFCTNVVEISEQTAP